MPRPDGFHLCVQYYRQPTPPPEEWEDDLKHIKSLGFTAVQLRPQWAWHEVEEGVFRWEDIDRLPVEFAEAAYHLWQLPTYLDNWKTLINAVTTIRGAHQRYSLTLDQLAQITQPVQFLWGANDVFGGLDVAHQIVTRMSDARLHEMDTGHLPFIDQPEESSRVIREFLEEETVEEEPVPTAAV